MAVKAVIFDLGGTLTPWHTIDHRALWLEVCAPHFPAGQAALIAEAIREAEFALWRQCETAQASATLEHVFARAHRELDPADPRNATRFGRRGLGRRPQRTLFAG